MVSSLCVRQARDFSLNTWDTYCNVKSATIPTRVWNTLFQTLGRFVNSNWSLYNDGASSFGSSLFSDGFGGEFKYLVEYENGQRRTLVALNRTKEIQNLLSKQRNILA